MCKKFLVWPNKQWWTPNVNKKSNACGISTFHEHVMNIWKNNRRNWQFYTETIKIKEISPTRYSLGRWWSMASSLLLHLLFFGWFTRILSEQRDGDRSPVAPAEVAPLLLLPLPPTSPPPPSLSHHHLRLRMNILFCSIHAQVYASCGEVMSSKWC